jgi:predicted ATPase/transcriptional regulator with XRE-family HTH domain
MATYAPSLFGLLLRSHRRAAALSQEALAERAGLSARGVADLERGVRRFPYLHTAKRLADSLGLTAEERVAFIEAAGRRFSDAQPRTEASRMALPTPPTSFVGREQDLTEVRGLLSGGRLLTLTGAGGVGKTRLALALATDVRSDYRDGVWFVDLGPLADDRLVIKSAASSLGIRERPGRPLQEIVCDTLADRSLLLILDNCEHVLSACAAFVAPLLSQCASVRVLATSREPLRIAGETRWRVPSLAVEQSAQLFAERARAVVPGFEVTEQRMAVIARICHQLEGVPLAIELAAARVAMFSVEQIADRLYESTRLLSSGARMAPPRQQTLRATIDWSYSLLPEADSIVLDRLTTFAGGWTFEAAEAVASGEGISGDDVLGLLGGLVDRSLVVAEPAEDGGVRYRLLEVLRQYGQQRLAELSQIDSARARHAAFFLNLAEEAEPRILGPDRKLWLDRLERELDNLRAARRWFVDSGSTECALRLATALYRLWMYRGYADEGSASLAEALAMDGGSAAARARALFCRGGLGVTIIQTDYASAQRDLEESVALLREVGDVIGTAWALMGVGAAASMRADFSKAASALAEARQVSANSGAIPVLALSLVWSADLAYAQGDFDLAEAFAEEAVEAAESIGFAVPACMALTTLGNLKWREGAIDLAEGLLESAVFKAEELDEAYPMVWAAISLALLAADRG